MHLSMRNNERPGMPRRPGWPLRPGPATPVTWRRRRARRQRPEKDGRLGSRLATPDCGPPAASRCPRSRWCSPVLEMQPRGSTALVPDGTPVPGSRPLFRGNATVPGIARGSAPSGPGLLVRILSKQTLSTPLSRTGGPGQVNRWVSRPREGPPTGQAGWQAARPDQAGMAMNGLTVGWTVPPGGSTVMPKMSPRSTPEMSTGPVRPLCRVSRPSDRILLPFEPISQSW